MQQIIATESQKYPVKGIKPLSSTAESNEFTPEEMLVAKALIEEHCESGTQHPEIKGAFFSDKSFDLISERSTAEHTEALKL